MATTETGHTANRVYWDADGNIHMNGGKIYADESGGELAGSEIAFLDAVTAGTAAASKAVVLDSSKGIATITSATITTLTTGAITSVDSSLGVAGLAATAATGGAIVLTGGATTTSGVGGLVSLTGGAGAGSDVGGAASIVGGLGGATDAAGGAATVTAGAGNGTGNGAIAGIVGGASGGGATGTGGVARLIGGAAASVNGTGGAGQLTGGIATGTGTGGACVVTGGASAGASGTGGDVSLASGAATGGAEGSVKVQTVATGKVGFFNVTPVVRASAFTQTYATADRTHANPTASSVVTTGVTQTTPFGYVGAAQGDAVASTINQIIVDQADVKALVNSVIDDLQAYGILA
jgi:hypothetical protein